MELYRLTQSTMERVPENELDNEAALENHLVKAEGTEIGGVEVLYVGRQGSPDAGGIFDILGLDAEGNVVVLELKRGRTPRTVVAQALEYAAGIRQETYEDLNDRYQRFRREHDDSERNTKRQSLADAHAAYFGLEGALSEREFNADQRLVVVGTHFGDVALNMADFLREHGIDVVCVEYSAFATGDDTLELLTTDAIRRPLRMEPSGTSSDTTDPSYPEFLLAVRDDVYPRLKDTLGLDEPENIAQGRPNKQINIKPNGSTDVPVHYSVKSNLDERGTVSVKISIWGTSDENRERLQALLADLSGELDGFETDPTQSSGVVYQELAFPDYDSEDGNVDREIAEAVVDELVRMVEYYHPKLSAEFED